MTISVTQLNNYIRGLIDMDGILNNVSVCGEVTNVKRYGDGWYFSLKDDGGAINCFSYAVATIKQGDVIVAEGSLNFYVKNGSVSLFVKRVNATKNTGDAYLRFVELKNKLQAEGLFDDDRKQIVPSFCSKIGIVTSATGAVIVDITNVALRRQPFANLFLYPVKVQGEGAEQEIVAGINYFAHSDVDVVIVGRGGGSNEDLSVFNSEGIVRAIANCPKPVVSAVGHGVDYTLCDFVADRRAVTPSEAAEFVTTDVRVVKQRVCSQLSKISIGLTKQIDYNSQLVVSSQKQVSSKISYQIDANLADIKHYLNSAHNCVCHSLDKKKSNLDNLTARLCANNPMSLLKRGYTVVSKGGKTVKSTAEISQGDSVQVQFADGKIIAVVSHKE